MTRTIRAAVAAAILTSGLCSVGCVGTGGNAPNGGKTLGDHTRSVYDPCYPERYNHAARQAVLAPFAQQVHNGHVLNQTIFTYYFEAGTDKLTSAGTEKLDSIAGTRPAPDPRIYIQSATDLAMTDANAAKIVALRGDLDAKRAVAIQKYLATVSAFAPISYEVYVHNPATPGINSEFAGSAYRASATGYRGNISGGGGGGATSTGGGTALTAPPAAGAAPR